MSSIVEMSAFKRMRRLNKSELAQVFEVSLSCVDGWIRRGCPHVHRGGLNRPWIFDAAHVIQWRYRSRNAAPIVDPDEMIPTDRKAWYESEVIRRRLIDRDAELYRAEEVQEVVKRTLQVIADSKRGMLQGIKSTGAGPEALRQAEIIIAAAIESLRDQLRNLVAVEADGHQLQE